MIHLYLLNGTAVLRLFLLIFEMFLYRHYNNEKNIVRYEYIEMNMFYLLRCMKRFLILILSLYKIYSI